MVDVHKVESSADVIHETEGLGYTIATVWYVCVLKQAKVSDNSCFLSAILMHQGSGSTWTIPKLSPEILGVWNGDAELWPHDCMLFPAWMPVSQLLGAHV